MYITLYYWPKELDACGGTIPVGGIMPGRGGNIPGLGGIIPIGGIMPGIGAGIPCGIP